MSPFFPNSNSRVLLWNFLEEKWKLPEFVNQEVKSGDKKKKKRNSDGSKYLEAFRDKGVNLIPQ